jgi:enoyl-CoA hydratase/carnithine racemase
MTVTAISATGAVRLDRDEHVATLTLDRAAKRNALTPEMLRALDAHLVALGEDRETRVVIIRGAGERAFCAGADIDRFAALGAVDMWRSWIVLGHTVFDRLAALPQPVIAVLHGNAFGGGLELALAADFRVIADEARVGLPEAGLGTVPGWGGTERLVEVVGRARAKDIVLARTVIDGRTALAWGLASRCAPAAELDAAVDDLTAALLAGAPVAVQVAKQLIDAAADGAPSRVLEPLAGALTATTTDLAEGVAAFRARRPAAFQGH